MRIYLHIGIHKTGTTALQHALRDNAALLAENGVRYPVAGRPDEAEISLGHHLLPWTLIRPETIPGDPWSKLRSELSHASERAAVLSSEEFDVVSRGDQFSRLREELHGHDVKVIVYLRRQDEVLHAMYSTDVVYYREARPFEVFRSSFRTELDYRVLLSRWEEWFGREGLIVRVYEREHLVGGHIVLDFLDCLGLSGLALAGQTKHLINRSFPRNILKLLIELRESGVEDDRITDVIRLANAVYQGRSNSDIVSPTERLAIIEQYKESNAYVASTYLGREDGHLFDDPDLGDESEWEARYQMPRADLIATLEDARRRLLDLAAERDALAELVNATSAHRAETGTDVRGTPPAL